jgi:polyisoprenoid-binding protein YceI
MSTHIDIPGYVAGTWTIDTVHSAVFFHARVLGVLTTRGTFDDFEGTIVTTENPLDSSVNAVIRTASVNTRNKRRDRDLRKDGYLNVGQYPTMTFTSTGVRADGDHFLIDGDLTVRAVRKPVTLTLEPKGFGIDGRPLARFTAHTELSRNEFGVTCGRSGPAISDKVRITLEVQASRQD